MPDQSPLAFAVILASLGALGLLMAGRDLLTLFRRREAGDCTRCGEPFNAGWPARTAPTVRRGVYQSVHICPRCGTERGT